MIDYASCLVKQKKSCSSATGACYQNCTYLVCNLDTSSRVAILTSAKEPACNLVVLPTYSKMQRCPACLHISAAYHQSGHALSQTKDIIVVYGPLQLDLDGPSPWMEPLLRAWEPTLIQAGHKPKTRDEDNIMCCLAFQQTFPCALVVVGNKRLAFLPP